MIRVEVHGAARVGKTTLVSHLAYCLRKSGYEVEIDDEVDPGELENLPPYFLSGQKVTLVEVDTTPMPTKKSSRFSMALVVICGAALSSLFFLPIEKAVFVLTVFVIGLMVTSFVSGVR